MLLVMVVIQPCCPNVGFALLILFLLFLLCAAHQVLPPKHVSQRNCTNSSSEQLGLAVSIGYGSFMRLHHKYSHLHGSSRGGLPMSAQHFSLLRSHDSLRHRRHRSHRRSFIDLQQEEEEEQQQQSKSSSSSSSSSFSAASFPLGGHANPYSAGLYFTELEVGTPASSYYAQVDTGSDLLWLSCDSCRTCPVKTDLGVNLQPYSPVLSRTSRLLVCEEQFCGPSCAPGKLCAYKLTYGDGTTAEGFYIEDTLLLQDMNNESSVGTIVFGCTVYVNRGLDNDAQNRDQALNGILGLGPSNSSIIQQLALQKKTPRVFAHCLEGEGGGGGILVIGQVMESGLSYTPMQSNQMHYSVLLKSINVSDRSLQIGSHLKGTGQVNGTVFDSGTTLAYIPQPLYQDLLEEILLSQSSVVMQGNDEFTCIIHQGSLDEDFPALVFTFEGGAYMTVLPHDYFIRVQKAKDAYCFGILSSPPDSPDVTILGDLVLKNKLVVYDLENRQIGWMDYNCSSNITVRGGHGDERISATMLGGSHRFSADNAHSCIKTLAIALLIFVLSALR